MIDGGDDCDDCDEIRNRFQIFFQIQDESGKILGDPGSSDPMGMGFVPRGWGVDERSAIAHKLYGLEKHLERLKSVLLMGPKGPKVVGIVGTTQNKGATGGSAPEVGGRGSNLSHKRLVEASGTVLKIGGIGKTTLVRTLFQDPDIQRNFSGGMFWVDVRKSSGDAFAIQKSLWKQLAGVKSLVDGDIFPMVKKELEDKRVLIVFDDVSDPETIRWAYDALSDAGRLVITTRDEHVLGTNGGAALTPTTGPPAAERPTASDRAQTAVLRLSTMGLEDSMRLLCRYAFGSEEPPPRFESLADSVCRECGGLPLALTVIGSALHGKDLDSWKYTLRRLQGARAIGEQFSSSSVFDCLRVAFDGLSMDDPRLQDLFLDLAAFPENEHVLVDRLILLWTSSRDVGGSENEALALLALLISRSLVQWGFDASGKAFCQMHGVLRDLALEITSITAKDFKGKGHGGLSLKLASKVGDLAVGGEPAPAGVHDQDVARRERVFLTGPASGEVLSAASQWMEDVTALGLAARREGQPVPAIDARKVSLMATDITSFSLPVSIPKLEVLLLGKNAQLADLSHDCLASCQQLRAIDLSNCTALIHLPKSLATLRELRVLDLSGCWRLRLLPDSLGSLAQLRVLNLHKCKSLRSVPRSLGQLVNLRVLDLCGVESAAKILPFEIGRLTRLERLDLSGLTMGALPPEIGNLCRLQYLCAKNNHLEVLPSEVNGLDQLTTLDVSSNRLRELPFSASVQSSLDRLAYLDASCNNLKELPPTLGLALTQLTMLNVSYNPLETLPCSIGQMSELRELHAWGTSIRLLPPSLSAATNLKVLKVRRGVGVSEDAGGGGEIQAMQRSLSGLFTAQRHSEDQLPRRKEDESGDDEAAAEDSCLDFSSLRQLVDVDLEACPLPPPALRSLMTVSGLRSLTFDCRNADLMKGEAPAHAVDFSGLQCLEHLRISSLMPSSLWPSLGQLPKLRELELYNLSAIVRFARLDFGHLRHLEVLKLSGSNSIMFPVTVGKLTQLRELLVKGFGRLTHCDNVNFEQLTCLEKVSWWGCSSIERLPKTLGKASKLTSIVVGHCPRLSFVPKDVAEKLKKRQVSFFTYNICEPVKYF
ncbi:hypothetical protein CBR_g2753 [Chara braunii]|uniref:NB-ARC domain-containing protein n=1 Tax=Chara braunii TaxID=69332 RepID=A0A388KDT9_CHABU|nr:hypothetical protein CBR_g2753 [Chara braunii]|eukprot:GBG68201.1 hypothetical protein CBR_g2753 [Chara braunii]